MYSRAKKLLFSLLVVFVSGVAQADPLIEKAEQILAQEPEKVFARDVEEGTVGFVHVPLCAEGLPGFDFKNYRGQRPNSEELWSSCSELIGPDRHKLLLELEEWARTYNELVYEHVTGKKPE